VTFAIEHHPRIAGARAVELAAAAHTGAARLDRLPHAGVTAQLNRSTGNTSPGAFFATPGVPPIAGAPRGRTFDSGAWQTGLGAWASWDALSLIRQSSAIDAALAAQAQAQATTDLARLEVAFHAADAFLSLLEAQETVRAAEAGVARAETVRTVVSTLVAQALRPGADAARLDAELAAARTQAARARQSVDVRRVQLGEALGDAALSVEPVAPSETHEPAQEPTTAVHPLVAIETAQVARAEGLRGTVSAQYLPRVDLVSAVWARGSGYYGSGADGLAPDIPNWGAGIVVAWDLLDVPAIRARASAADAEREAAVARNDEAQLAVASQLAQASALLDGARSITKEAAVTLGAARTAEAQTVARFKTGLSSVVDVADAQRVLVQAEIDDAVARLEVLRAELLLARAAGDLTPFLRAAGGD
jgi:outer membrane protein TolC